MPVTAKLSHKFYERFGDEIAGELVDWFNAVDLTYQTQLREMNDLNWERFKATLLAETASLRGDFRAETASLRGDFRADSASLRGDFRAEIAALRTEMAEMRAELLRWMFIYWTGAVVGLGGLIVGMAMFGPR